MVEPGERELVLVGGRRRLQRAPASRRTFGAAKQDLFFAALRETCNVQQAARAAKVCRQTVYRHRTISAAFRTRWAEVLSEAYADLELAMLERTLNGTVKEVTRCGKVHETVREYPNAVALQLLRMHRDSAIQASLEHDPVAVEELREKLARKIERLRERQLRERGGAAE